MTNKNKRINSINSSYNNKISYESYQIKGLNFTNITNNTNSNNNNNINIHVPFINNKDDEISKKSRSTFIIDNNNIKDNLYSYEKIKINKNNINNNCVKEEILNNSPLKHIHNVNININNQININNSNQFNDILTFNTKINKKLSKMNINNINNLKEIKNIRNKNQYIISNSKKILFVKK